MNVKSNIGRSSTATIVTSSGTVLAANAARVDGLVQNLGTVKLYVKKGPNCSDTDFTSVLAPGASTDDGYGGSLPLSGYAGQVSVYSAVSVRCVVSEDVG